MQLLLKIRTVILLSIVYVGVLVTPADARDFGIDTSAKYAVVFDHSSNTILLSKNADVPMGPSSMTKMMTAYAIFDALERGAISLEDTLTVSERAWKKGGSKMFVEPRIPVSVEDLVQGIVVQSGNDACIVMAEALSGSEEGFAEDMNFLAKKIGLDGSHFKNSTGWPDEGHVMTAKDLAMLTKHLIEDFPQYYHYFAQKEFTYNKIKQANRNKLLYRNIGSDGLKTGYTKDNGYGIVASAVQDGRRITVAINGLSSSTERASEAERLLRHGFRDFEHVTLVEKDKSVEQVKVWLGKESTVPLVVNEDVKMVIDKRLSKRGDVAMEVTYNEPVMAPIQKGDELGTLTIRRAGTVQEIPLYAGEEIEKRSFFGRMLNNAKYYILGSV